MDFSKIKENLQNMGYEVSEFDTKEAAIQYMKGAITGKTVGFGGSITVKEMGLYDALATDNQLFWHWADNQGMSGDKVLKMAQTADIYISSVNGISTDGEIVNIDGNCNRTSAMMFGHEKVYFVVGENKIADTLKDAIFRARNVAAPLNAKRLDRKTPCAKKADKCYNCNSPERICKNLSVFWKKPSAQPMEVVLIHEKLGY